MRIKTGTFTVLTLAVAVLIGSTAMAQPGGGGRQGGGRGGFGGFGGGGGATGTIMLLLREDVNKEIELLDDQKEELQELQSGMRDRMREVFANFREMSDDERREAMTDFGKSIQEDIDEVLLPHQSKRIKQIALQQQMAGGTTRGLRGEVAEELGLSEDDLEEIEEKSREAASELQKKISELRAEAQKELLSEVLTPSQQKKLKEMMGEKFEFDTTQRAFGGRGGFGGQGGGQGGQGGRGGFGGRGGGRGGRPQSE